MPSVDQPRPAVRASRGALLGVVALALAVRLGTVLHGGGLYGRIGYDGSVYYASAAALAHGLLPYRDFLLLHPPGIVLALLPFAALGRLVGDADAYAGARLAWCALGTVSTALVFVLVRVRGRVPAVLAAGCYALLVPAVTSERTTSLEAVGSVCLLGALVLLTRGLRGHEPGRLTLLAAGVLLGFSTSTKIWGAALVLVLVAWTAVQGPRPGRAGRAFLVLAGAVGTSLVVCLPFFVAAPAVMWRMVVLDQLGRPRVDGSVVGRLLDVLGLTGLRGVVGTAPLAAVALLVGVLALVLAVRDPLGRLAAVLLAATTAVLLLTPPWSVAYTALAAPPLALLLGTAVGRFVGVGSGAGARTVRTVVPAVVALGLAVCAVFSLPGVPAGSRFPGRSLTPVLAALPGCVTTDDPIALIETGALQRNLDRRCPVVVDLSGYSWDLQPAASRGLSRSANLQWQRFALRHLASGDASVVVRFRNAPGLSRRTRSTIATWPLRADVGGYQVRGPRVSPGTAPG